MGGFDLRQYGFTNCTLSEDLHDISSNLPHWDTIPQVTEKFIGSSRWEHFKSPLKDGSGNLYLPSFEWGTKLDEGTYGKIYLAKRKLYRPIGTDISGRVQFGSTQEQIRQIVIKESPIVLTPKEQSMPIEIRKKIIIEEIQAHIHEAAVMTLAHMAVKRANYESASPRVYEIFCHSTSEPKGVEDIHSICIAMEYIHGNTLLKYMTNQFKIDNKPHNDKLMLHFIKQIAKILLILQKTLRMNHRDIKINNILLRDKSTEKPHIVLIDYGFACIANGIQEPDAEMSNIEAGAFFGSRYACFKHGRDFCQFLYSLHCYFPLDMYLTERVLELIRPWLQVSYKYGTANLMNGLTQKGYHYPSRIPKLVFDEGIYYFLRRPEVDPLHCSPESILGDIEAYRVTEVQSI